MGACVAVLLVLAAGAASTTPAITTAPIAAPSLAMAQPAAGVINLDRLVVRGPVADVAPEPVPVPAPPPPAPAPPPPPPVETVIAPPPAVFAAAPAPPPAPPVALQSPSPFQGVIASSGTWAVIIGINDYPGVSSDLRSAVTDANDMDLALAQMGVAPDHRLVLRDGQATGAMIRTAADWLAAHAGPEAVAVFFYSGHVRKLGRTSEALVGADGVVVSDADLAARLSRLKAERAWIAIAACYGAGFTEVLAPGRVLTGAAPADSLAYETTAFGRSYMVQYMVREALIERRAPGSVQAAFAYARTEIAREHPNRQPVQIDAGVAPLDLRPGAPVPRRPGAPTASGGTPPPPTPTTTQPPRSCFLLVCGG